MKPTRSPKEFAIYKGDKFLDICTIDDFAELIGVSKSTAMFYAYSKDYKKRASYNDRYIFVDFDPPKKRRGGKPKIIITPQHFLDMRRQGKTYTDIAKELDVNYTTLYHWRKKHEKEIDRLDRVVESPHASWY